MFFEKLPLFRKKDFVSAVIAAGGKSERMGQDKLFINICGIPAIAHTLTAFQNCKDIDEIIVVSSEKNVLKIEELKSKFSLSKISNIVLGGENRTKSVYNGIEAVSSDTNFVAVHDGARIAITPEQISNVVNLAKKTGSALLAVPVKDTIKLQKDGFVVSTVPRDEIFAAQTPQVFDLSLIKGALSNAIQSNINITDDCSAVELIGGRISICPGSYRNIKLTTEEDISVAETFITEQLISEKFRHFSSGSDK